MTRYYYESDPAIPIADHTSIYSKRYLSPSYKHGPSEVTDDAVKIRTTSHDDGSNFYTNDTIKKDVREIDDTEMH